MSLLGAVYKPIPFGNLQSCQAAEDDDYLRILDTFNGTSHQSTWKPVAVTIVHESMGRRLGRSDAPWYGSNAMVFRLRTAEILVPLLVQYGELLPLQCDEADLVIYNVTNALDALDEKRSAIERFESGDIMEVMRYVFCPRVIGASQIFKLSNMRSSATFVGQAFVDLWNSSGLHGLVFDRVWSPDTGFDPASR